MAFCRFLNFGISRLTPARNFIVSKQKPVIIGSEHHYVSERHFRKSWGTKLRVMKERRKLAGPDKLRRRSDYSNWNYKSELFAFPNRLHENISEATLRTAFTHETYLKEEEQKRRDLEMPSQDVQLDLQSNVSLTALGNEIISNYLDYYLPYCYPKLPTEGIAAVKDFLTSVPVLSHISFNLGTKDLILSSEYPPEDATYAATFKAIVGSIATDNSVARAENFVLDFVCPQLIGKDVFEIWDVEDPLAVVNSILKRSGVEECEPRLIAESGRNTIESVYHVGLYVNKVFLARGPGETLAIATEMAAYHALRKLFGIQECDKPIPFGEKARKDDLKLSKIAPLTVNEWCSNDLKIYMKQ